MKQLSKEEIDLLLSQLRENLSDVLETNGDFDCDFYLYRWLIHNDMKVENVAKLIRASIKWRKEYNVSELVEKDWAFWDPELRNEIKLLHFGGVSKQGQPVITAVIDGVDFRTQLRKFSAPSGFRYAMQFLAKLEKYMLDHYKSQEHTKENPTSSKDFYKRWNTSGPFIVFSVTNFSVSNVTCLEGIKTLFEIADAGMKYFPACANEIHAVNLNRFSKIVLSFIQRLLSSEIFYVEFHDQDKSKWMARLLEKIEEEEISVRFLDELKLSLHTGSCKSISS